jgi:hypothetical protein
MTEFLTKTRDLAEDDADKVVLTVFAHPPASTD